MLPEDIDWNAMWKEKSRNPLSQSDMHVREEYWDQMAVIYRQGSENDEYPSRILQRIKIWHEWSTLNIGCGMGTIAIAAAIRGNRVTVIDISSRMLEMLKTDAQKRYMGNIRYIHEAWENIRTGTDIRPHDVVISSRSIMVTENLKESLEKINRVALRYAYVTAWGGKEGDFTRGMREILYQSSPGTSEDVYIYNILHNMGIRPNVEYFECPNTILYQDPQQALIQYLIPFDPSPEVREKAEQYLMSNLVQRKDGKFELPDSRTVWSLIWWKKPDLERDSHPEP